MPSGTGARSRTVSLAHWVGTLGGIGRVGVAPGTVASAAALGCAAAIPAPAYGPTLALLVVAGIAVAPWAARVMAQRSGDEDPPSFVLDEAVGVWLAALNGSRPSSATFVVVFVLFRAFDIWKPGPIRTLERLGRGWGVVLDDVAAGALTLVVVAAIRMVEARLQA